MVYGVTALSTIDQITLSSHSGSANSGETLYVDNLYTSKPEPPLEVTFSADDDPGYDFSNVTGGTAQLGTGVYAAGGDSPVALLTKIIGEDIVGASFLTVNSGELISDSNGQVSMRVWTQNNDVNVRLRLEDITSGDTVELGAVTGSDKANQWQTISWDFSELEDHTPNFNKAYIFFDAVNASATEYYLFDDVQFDGATG